MPSLEHRETTAAIDAVAEVLTQSLDALEGYATMVEKAEPQFRPIAERFRALHASHSTSLAEMVKRLGGVPDMSGSYMGKLDKAVVTLASVFGAIDQHEMKHVRSGEQSVLHAFAKAVSAGLPASEQARVLTMQGELLALLDNTRDLA
ncbi:DUF2383 domain-containing protein [Rhodobacter ferrooxidans]|uniref:DUF2383 domain-containing protein n=1 Tax=Rhodobacter ferrooxidans TaxID=371731 RepID=C8RZX1_9RHOB|nr:DUF2383 domain-containing protein [Rhodobacter sp. SW2]EEW25580.1 hypothetical protein Rsw2DRAFT_1349 [Rhodobacter sp. SW2]